MKKFTVFFVLLLATSLYVFGQTIRVANNNAGAATGPNVYTGTNALESAISNSVANDIIYVVPSAIGYGNNDINIDIPLTIFGVGMRPDKTLGTRSEIDVNCFQCAIEINASNVRISGLIIDGEINLNWDELADQTDITIENCRVERIIMNNAGSRQISNILIRNNVITGTGSLATHVLLKNAPGAVITNNIMTEGNIGSGNDMVKANSAIFSYNVFADLGNETPFDEVVDCIFDHNIFYGVRVDIPASSTGNDWTFNLSFGNTVDSYNVFDNINNGNTASNNIESTLAVPYDPLFVNFPLTQNWNDSYDLTLQAGSPALSTDPLNLSAEDIGPSGGLTPFDPEGNLLPLINSITVPAVIPVGTDLPVNIKATGN